MDYTNVWRLFARLECFPVPFRARRWRLVEGGPHGRIWDAADRAGYRPMNMSDKKILHALKTGDQVDERMPVFHFVGVLHWQTKRHRWMVHEQEHRLLGIGFFFKRLIQKYDIDPIA